jgi:hypothetical protein
MHSLQQSPATAAHQQKEWPDLSGMRVRRCGKSADAGERISKRRVSECMPSEIRNRQNGIGLRLLPMRQLVDAAKRNQKWRRQVEKNSAKRPEAAFE